MRILVTGSGGREHALCWKIAQSPLVSRVFCAPGNAGTTEVAENVLLKEAEIADWAKKHEIDLVVPGSEAPLVAGLADQIRENNILCFGPGAAAAALEESKVFAKQIMAEGQIPTADFKSFDKAEAAKTYIRSRDFPLVIKADGLAAGKGVIVANQLEEALAAVDKLQAAYGHKLLIEDYLSGTELSYFALCDGKRATGLTSAQDHKRVGEGDQGPNTGGMGAFSPTALSTDSVHREIAGKIVQPTLDIMARRGTPFSGVLFVGLMMTASGLKVIEFNVRFGDPECQVLMLRMKSDLVPLLLAAARGDLSGHRVEWFKEPSLAVVMANKGYPETFQKDSYVESLPENNRNLHVFHAGTTLKEGKLQATGGRVLNVTARGSSLHEARLRVYAALEQVKWDSGFYRRDIALKAEDTSS